MTIDSTGPETPEVLVPAAKPNGLATYFGIIFGPGEAFATLTRTPTWGWAAIAGMIFFAAQAVITMPEVLKVTQIGFAQSLAQMPADQRADASTTFAGILHNLPPYAIAGSAVVPWVLWLIAAVVLFVGSSIGKGSTNFAQAWILAVNAFVIVGLTAMVNSIIVAMRGPDAIVHPSDAYAIPSLGLLAQTQPKLFAFLYAFNPLQLWFYAVVGIGLQIVMRLKPAAAWITVAVFALIVAGIGAAGAK
jgi:hypothetical protein